MKRLIAETTLDAQNQYQVNYQIEQSINEAVFKSPKDFITTILKLIYNNKAENSINFNKKNFENFKKIDFNQFCTDYLNNSTAGNDIAYEINQFVNVDDNPNYQDVNMKDIQTYINNHEACKKDLDAMFNRFKDQLLQTNWESAGYYGFSDTDDNGNKPITKASELTKLDDKIGQVSNFTGKIDSYNRDYPFVLIYPDVYLKGKEGEYHTELIQDWCKENNIDMNQSMNDKKEERVTEKDLQDTQKNNNTSYDLNKCAFGHVISNMAFIDTTQGMTIDDIVDKLKEQKFTKIYYFDDNNNTVKRLAKLKIY